MTETLRMIETFGTLGAHIHTLISTVPLPYQIFLLRAELEIKQAELQAMEEERERAMAVITARRGLSVEDTA